MKRVSFLIVAALLAFSCASQGVKISALPLLTGKCDTCKTAVVKNGVTYKTSGANLADSWNRTGNAGTTPGTHFVGTTDNKALMLKVNSTYAGFLNSVPATELQFLNGGLTTFGQYAGSKVIPIVQAGGLGGNNTLIGYAAGRNIGDTSDSNVRTPSDENVIIGNWAGAFLQNTSDGHGRNIIIGESAGFRMIAGQDNTFVGTFAGEWNNKGHGNQAFGRDALRSNIDGDGSTALGGIALGFQSTGISALNVTNGGTGYTTATVTISAPYGGPGPGNCWGAATATATISGGSIIGFTITNPGCGYSSKGGTFKPGYAHPAVTVTITGDGTGATATATIRSGEYNTAVGGGTGLSHTLGKYNTYLGVGAGGGNTRWFDEGVLYLGAYSDNSLPNNSTVLTNATAIGYNSRIKRSNGMALGGTGLNAVNVGIGTDDPTAPLDIASDNLRIRTTKTPSSATDTGTAGTFCWDANYLYICTATNTWKRVALSTW